MADAIVTVGVNISVLSLRRSLLIEATSMVWSM